MRIGVIDIENKTTEVLGHILKENGRNRIVSPIKCSPRDSLPNIALKSVSQTFDVICVNIESTFENNRRTDFKGAELIFWLRLKEKFEGLIISYGFTPLFYILRKRPDLIVLNAEGNIHIQLPHQLHHISHYLQKSIRIPFVKVKESYRPFIHAMFNVESIRHRIGNLYGIYLLEKTYNWVTGEKNEYSKNILKEIKPLNILLSDFLFSSSHLEDKNIWKQKINQLLSDLRFEIRNTQKKILYIDDNADQGWQYLFSLIFYEIPQASSFIVYSPRDKNITHRIRRFIKKEIDLVLLDLRLRNEEGRIYNLESLSGIKALQFIKKLMPSLPVIVVTSSNKANSILTSIKDGAESVWVKPNIDYKSGHLENLRNFYEFLDVSYAALTKYTSEIERRIHDFRVKMERWELNSNFKTRVSSELADATYIFFDSCYLMEPKNISNVYKLARYWKNQKVCIVIDEVLQELFRHTDSYTTKKGNKEDYKEKMLRAEFALEQIQKLKEQNRVYNMHWKLKESSMENIRYEYEKMDASMYRVYSLKKKSHSIHPSIKRAKADIYKRKNKGTLHADDVFFFLIKFLMEKRGNPVKIVLVSQDSGCKENFDKLLTLEKFERVAPMRLQHGQNSLSLYNHDTFNSFINSPVNVKSNLHR